MGRWVGQELSTWLPGPGAARQPSSQVQGLESWPRLASLGLMWMKEHGDPHLGFSGAKGIAWSFQGQVWPSELSPIVTVTQVIKVTHSSGHGEGDTSVVW